MLHTGEALRSPIFFSNYEQYYMTNFKNFHCNDCYACKLQIFHYLAIP